MNGIAPSSTISSYIRSNSNEDVSHSAQSTKYAVQAIQLLEEGKFQAALQLLNMCLGDTEEVETSELELESQVEELVKSKKLSKLEGLSADEERSITDRSSLIEKRCLVNMRLKRYSKVVHDAKKMLDFSGENPVAYKCLLVALCKMKKLDQANEVIKLWQKNSPRDLEMMECRTKLESLMVAVKNGIEAADAFSDVEDLLRLNFDWLLLRKSKDPQWKYRPLPTSSRCSFVLCLQYRFGHCSLGEKCPDAHGGGELEEWKKRYEIENVSRRISNLKVDDGSGYIKDLNALVQASGGSILLETDSEQIRITCISPLHTTVQQRKFKKFTWKFTVKTSTPLTHVCLLHEHHRQYFHISSCSLVGPNDSIILTQSSKFDATSQVIEPQLSEAALAIAGSNTTSYTYKVKVVFTPEVYGNFRQTVVFDVGNKTKTVRNVSVDVVPPPDSDPDAGKGSSEHTSSPVDRNKGYRNNIPWNFGNAEMVDSNTGEKMPSEKLGFALISGSSISKPESFMENTKDPLSKAHYKERMRFLLTQEERSRQEILAKYNVTTNVHLSEKYIVTGGYNEGMTRYAVDGTLYGRISLFRDISEDTAVGRLILRSCNAVLLTKSEESRRLDNSTKIRVYFCPISDKTKNSVYLDLGRTSVAELDLKDGDVMQFDIQFQLDRTAFIEQKKVIDQLEERHLNMLFPDLAINCNIPWSPIKQWSEIETSSYRLNPKQKEALIAITAENCRTPPILVIGPFGSGKTFTLAQCIRKILTQKNTRVMVCTHSNSAADLYIKEYLDSWVGEGVEEARPLRIYYEMRNLSSVHPVVLKYCTIEAMKFRPPTYDEVLNHRVIVVTLSTSYLLMEMNLPKDTFSHILLDEAAQAMESEAITPLMSAGDNTKLVLAGDHFQLSPELFSEEARNIHPSLLERLHALYSDAHPCKLMLCENYRSHSAIIQFVSESFYTKKLECAKSQPVHDSFFPLTFFAARGEDIQDSESTSYYNMSEVFELTEKISELISSWPEKWGDYRDENAIGVLTPYADQVNRIRSRLRKKGLHSVSVERVFNVQGKQFRAVFLSTVRTFRPWVRILPEAVGNEVDLGFFSSPKLLNTALTRAQSLVAVVGDPVSLCSVGKCRRIWEDYIRICHESKSLFGMTYVQLKQSILGVEMRLTWGLNPLANEFQPQQSFNRLPPVSSNMITTTVVTNPYSNTILPTSAQACYQYSKTRPRAPFPVESNPGCSYVAYLDGIIPPAVPPVHNSVYYPGSQNSLYMRPPYPGGLVQPYPGYMASHATSPWNPNMNTGMPLPNLAATPSIQVPNLPTPSNMPLPNVTGAANMPVPNLAGVQNMQVPNLSSTPNMQVPNLSSTPNMQVPNLAATQNMQIPNHGATQNIQLSHLTAAPNMPVSNVSQAPNIPLTNLAPGPNMQLPSSVTSAQHQVRPAGQPRATQYPTASVGSQSYPSHVAYGSGMHSSPYGNLNGGLPPGVGEQMTGPQNNPNYIMKSNSINQVQQHFAAGQPLYRRPQTSTNAYPTVSNTTPQQIHGAYDERTAYNQPVQFHDHQHNSQLSQKFTQDEVNTLTHMLEHHAASGEPMTIDIQNLRAKLLYAINSGEVSVPPRLAQQQHALPTPTNFTNNRPALETIPQAYQHAHYQTLNASGNIPAVQQNNVFTPIPHKSPAAAPMPSDRTAYSNAYVESSSSNASLHSRIWNNPTSNASFPTLNEGTNTMHAAPGPMHSHHQLVSNDRTHPFTDPNTRYGYTPQTVNAPGPALNNLPQRSLCGANNNSIGYSNNEYGYHADVGGGLKAQLSGGLRQGFGERSAFSRVNGGQDIDVGADSSLGRSYATVVKAAVTTAAVGTGVPSSTISMAGNVSRPQIQAPPVPASNAMFPMKYYGAAATGVPMHHYYTGPP